MVIWGDIGCQGMEKLGFVMNLVREWWAAKGSQKLGFVLDLSKKKYSETFGAAKASSNLGL